MIGPHHSIILRLISTEHGGRVDRDLLRRQVVRVRAASGSFSMRTNIVGTHWLCVTWYFSMQRERLLGIELLHHDHGAAEPHRAHAVEERRRVVQRRGRQVDGVARPSPTPWSSSPSRGAGRRRAGGGSCSARPSAVRWCPTNRASACLRAPLRAAPPDSDRVSSCTTRIRRRRRRRPSGAASRSASCRRARPRRRRNVSEITSTCASQSSRMYAVSSALKCQLMHV